MHSYNIWIVGITENVCLQRILANKYPQVLKEIIVAIDAYFKAHRFIRKHKLWKWIIIPGIVYAILFMVGMYYFSHTVNAFMAWMKGFTLAGLAKINSTFVNFLITLGSVFLWLILMMFYFSLFKYVFLIVGSPIFSYLSEKTEAIVEGKDYPFSLPQLIKDIVRGIRIAGRNALWQTVYVLSLIVLGFIPIVGWFTPILSLIIECYYYGFSMLDYSMERHKKSASESIFFIGNHKGLAIGNGLVFYALHLLPLIGWIFAPAYAVVAATLSLQGLKENKTAE